MAKTRLDLDLMDHEDFGDSFTVTVRFGFPKGELTTEERVALRTTTLADMMVLFRDKMQEMEKEDD